MTTQPTPADQLAELVPLVERLGWMPEELTIHGDIGAGYTFRPNGIPEHDVPPTECFRIRRTHALDLITAECERRLRERGWNSISPGSVHDTEWEHDERNTGYISLPAALRAEIERARHDTHPPSVQ